MSMASPKVITERMTVITVPIGLNIDTRTGPLFFIAHPLKLTQTPLIVPACSHILIIYLKLMNYYHF